MPKTRAQRSTPERVALLVSEKKARPHSRRLQALAHRFLRHLSLEDVELSVSLVDDETIQTLNREWRNKDKPTDVLSFPAGELPPGVPAARPLGDIVISYDTTVRQAREQGRTVEEELARYLAHGLLHLLGHDHETPSEAKAMAALEDALLGAPGMVRTAVGAGSRRGAGSTKSKTSPGRRTPRKAPGTRAVSRRRGAARQPASTRAKRGRGTKGRP